MAANRDLRRYGPAVIGATGGSGTRVIARVLRRGGLYIGTDLNPAEDARAFGRYSERWINTFLAREMPPLPQVQDEMARDLAAVLEEHCAPLAGMPRPWGWKEPRSIYLLPFFHGQFPSTKFLHVVRDGRDMAFSSNQNQLRKHGGVLLRPEEEGWSQPLRSIAMWNRINLRASDYGEQRMPAQYLRVRFEDLCTDPVPTIDRIFGFLGLDGDVRDIARLEVVPPPSLGRWQHHDQETLVELRRLGEAALRKFGYLASA